MRKFFVHMHLNLDRQIAAVVLYHRATVMEIVKFWRLMGLLCSMRIATVTLKKPNH